MKTHMIDLSKLELETLAEMANDAAEQAENSAKATVQRAMDAGRFLNAAKEQCEHGTWMAWLGVNWNYKHVTATAYMRIANIQHAEYLKDAKSIREALRMIGEEKEDQSEVAESAIVPRAERKTGRVEVSEVGQTVVQADEVKPAKDDDPNPEPKTNTKHSPATAKVKEADRPAPMKVTPVIVEEPPAEADVVVGWFRSASIDDIVTRLIERTENAFEQKKTAKALRKWADKLDPPTKFVKPTVEDVAEYCRERKNSIDPEMVVAHYAANGWKLANGNKLNDWKSAVITWEKRNDSGIKQVGHAIAGSGRIKPDAIDESAITWK